MAIMTISRGSFSRGREVAELVAQRLGYDCVSRDIILDASEHFKIPEVKLTRAIHDAPSILERFTYGKEKYVAYFQAALLKFLREDNMVYHGLAGHFFLPRISHVLKVRIIADPEDRIRLEMEREGISYQEALRQLKQDDEQRRKWSYSLYGIDTSDPALYDLVIHIQKISVLDAADILVHAVKRECFQTTPESLKAIRDLALAAEVRAALVELDPAVEVTADDGCVRIMTRAPVLGKTMGDELEKAARSIRGVDQVEAFVHPLTRCAD
jgi:cytidylate kinase